MKRGITRIVLGLVAGVVTAWLPVLAAPARTTAPAPTPGEPIHATAGTPIFADGFESGDAGVWSRVVPPPPPGGCVRGAPVTGLQAGDLGPAPGGSFTHLTCLEIANDRLFARDGESAWAGIPLPRALALTDPAELVLIGPGERRLAAQLDVLARWGGAPDDVSLPIRWLQVTTQPRIAAGETVAYALRRHATPPPPAADPFAVTVTTQGALRVVDTGVATFTLDPANPALFERIAVDLAGDGSGRVEVYRHAPGAGPSLTFAGPAGDVVLDTAVPGRVTVDPGSFTVVESGPVKAVVTIEGHFVDPGGASLCTRDGLSYQRFGYTLVASFHRARRDVWLEYVLRNECSDGFGGGWTDDAVTVRRAAWSFPLVLGAVTHHAGGGGAIVASPPAFAGTTRVEQRRGGGSPWLRRARVLRGGAVLESAEVFAEPYLAVDDGTVVADLALGWMRFREPQALAATGSTLELELIGESLVLGEGKGLWHHARLGLAPAPAPATLDALLEARRRHAGAELERGLLVHPPRAWTDAAALYPALGTGASSAVKSAYLQVLGDLHDQTVSADGQWHRAKTFGAQLWPDVQFDRWQIDNPDPAANDLVYNYWSPSGAELFEQLRSGDPRWGWDFALPQVWLQLHTAYLNVGDETHSNRNGFAVTSGGGGDGHWHRRDGGSDDYTYDVGHELAYLLRPSPAVRARFAQAGRTVVDRYSVPRTQEGQRERFVDQVDVTRQVIQHFELLMNCADFVPGPTGDDCRARLHEVVAELAADNLAAGVFCQEDVPSATVCDQPQQFMQAAMHHRFFHRYRQAWGHLPTVDDATLRRALVEGPRRYYLDGIAKQAGGIAIDVAADWAAQLECALAAGGTEVAGCSWVANGDGVALLGPNKAHTVALLLVAHQLDPSIALCAVAKTALDDPALVAPWQEFLGNESGWWKGAAQMLQGMVFAVGGYDVCVDP